MVRNSGRMHLSAGGPWLAIGIGSRSFELVILVTAPCPLAWALSPVLDGMKR